MHDEQRGLPTCRTAWVVVCTVVGAYELLVCEVGVEGGLHPECVGGVAVQLHHARQVGTKDGGPGGPVFW